MTSRLIMLLFLLCSFGVNSFSQVTTAPQTVEQLIEDLQSGNREVADAALEKLPRYRRAAVPAATMLAVRSTADPIIRARAVSVLGRIKDKASAPVLIKLLADKDSYIRGTAAYALSQVGGEDARRALLKFLKSCLREDHENLPRVTEAFVYLPDARAFPSLMEIVNIAIRQKSLPDSRNQLNDIVRNSTLPNAARALGKLGDPRASEPLARLLDPGINHINSQDYLYLEAISKTGGTQAVPYLVRYLEKIVQKIKAEPPRPDAAADITDVGFENRQHNHNTQIFRQTIECLEKITGRQTAGVAPAEKLSFWQDYLKLKTDNLQKNHKREAKPDFF